MALRNLHLRISEERPLANGDLRLLIFRLERDRSSPLWTTWVINSPNQFRPGGPPDLTSAEYAAVFNETKTMGAQYWIAPDCRSDATCSFLERQYGVVLEPHCVEPGYEAPLQLVGERQTLRLDERRDGRRGYCPLGWQVSLPVLASDHGHYFGR